MNAERESRKLAIAARRILPGVTFVVGPSSAEAIEVIAHGTASQSPTSTIGNFGRNMCIPALTLKLRPRLEASSLLRCLQINRGARENRLARARILIHDDHVVC